MEIAYFLVFLKDMVFLTWIDLLLFSLSVTELREIANHRIRDLGGHYKMNMLGHEMGWGYESTSRAHF